MTEQTRSLCRYGLLLVCLLLLAAPAQANKLEKWAESAGDAVEQAGRKTGDALEDAGDWAAKKTDAAAEQTNDTGKKIRKKAEELTDAAGEKLDKAGEKVNDAADKTGNWVSRKWQGLKDWWNE